MQHLIQNHIRTNPEEAVPGTTMTEISIVTIVLILLNNMGTFMRGLNPTLAIVVQIMKSISILRTELRMEPDGEAEVEGGEKEIEV